MSSISKAGGEEGRREPAQKRAQESACPDRALMSPSIRHARGYMYTHSYNSVTHYCDPSSSSLSSPPLPPPPPPPPPLPDLVPWNPIFSLLLIKKKCHECLNVHKGKRLTSQRTTRRGDEARDHEARRGDHEDERSSVDGTSGRRTKERWKGEVK